VIQLLTTQTSRPANAGKNAGPPVGRAQAEVCGIKVLESGVQRARKLELRERKYRGGMGGRYRRGVAWSGVGYSYCFDVDCTENLASMVCVILPSKNPIPALLKWRLTKISISFRVVYLNPFL
jgi:hypothetical protein